MKGGRFKPSTINLISYVLRLGGLLKTLPLGPLDDTP